LVAVVQTVVSTRMWVTLLYMHNICSDTVVLCLVLLAVKVRVLVCDSSACLDTKSIHLKSGMTKVWMATMWQGVWFLFRFKDRAPTTMVACLSKLVSMDLGVQ